MWPAGRAPAGMTNVYKVRPGGRRQSRREAKRPLSRCQTGCLGLPNGLFVNAKRPVLQPLGFQMVASRASGGEILLQNGGLLSGGAMPLAAMADPPGRVGMHKNGGLCGFRAANHEILFTWF